MFALRFKLTPSPLKFFDGIQSIKTKLRDFRKVWKQLLPIFGSEMARTIREAGSPVGATWAPHSPASITRFGAKQHALLQNKGRLLRTVYRDGKQKLTKNVLRYGPKRRSDFVQHFGSQKRKIPSRPFVALTQPMSNAARALMDQQVARILAEASAMIGRPSS